jgi:basic membrane protein A
VTVAEDGDTIVLSGLVADAESRASALGAATALADGRPIDAGALTVAQADPAPVTDSTVGAGTPAAAMQRELARILAGTPIIFDTGVTQVSERHQRILNNVVPALQAYPDVAVTVVGYTDDQGDPETNEAISRARAESVRSYLVTQGVNESRLQVRGVGESTSTGSPRLAGLERRVEFAVAGTPGATSEAVGGATLRVGLVAPSARSDLAFTQSMADALTVLASERSLEVSITDNTFVPEDASAALRTYAEQGYDLVVAHGSQFGAGLQDIALEYPEVVFAWGTASDTFGLPNVYAYDARAQEGGYVLGALAASLSGSGVVGVVGPIEVGDAALYVNGFRAGAEAERPGTQVNVAFTGSFSDVGLAAEAASAHIDAGADVMTGSAQMVVGAVEVAADRNVPWFGTQADQAPLAPDLVVASQVYRWEVVLRPILDDVAQGVRAGRTASLTLANGGLELVFNDRVEIPTELRARADKLSADIAAGLIIVPV